MKKYQEGMEKGGGGWQEAHKVNFSTPNIRLSFLIENQWVSECRQDMGIIIKPPT